MKNNNNSYEWFFLCTCSWPVISNPNHWLCVLSYAWVRLLLKIFDNFLSSKGKGFWKTLSILSISSLTLLILEWSFSTALGEKSCNEGREGVFSACNSELHLSKNTNFGSPHRTWKCHMSDEIYDYQVTRLCKLIHRQDVSQDGNSGSSQSLLHL